MQCRLLSVIFCVVKYFVVDFDSGLAEMYTGLHILRCTGH